MPKKVVLAVDDITINLMSIRNALSIYSDFIELRLAKSSKLALDVLKNYHIDLILLDIEMPGISGFELVEMLKDMNNAKDIPVIFVTSNSDPNSVIKAFNLSAVDYVVKPVNLVALRQKVIQALNISLPPEYIR